MDAQLNNLMEWALKWRVNPQALRELCEMCVYVPPQQNTGATEARIQSEIRLVAARAGKRLFRNNRGAGKLESGNHVRFGLGNDSEQLNKKFKSGDLIGWEQVTITPEMAGTVIARFLSVEVKAGGWKFSGSADELAQVTWAQIVNSEGGRAIITNDPTQVGL